MGGRISYEMYQAMELVKAGISPYAAARKFGLALSTMYKSALYLEWKDAQRLRSRTSAGATRLTSRTKRKTRGRTVRRNKVRTT